MEAQAAAITPTRAIVLLYERLLADLRKAERFIKERKPAEKSECLLHANAILYELLASLDEEQGGSVARDLAEIYTYLINEITEIDATRDLGRLGRTIELLETLHGAWVIAYENVQVEA